ncbi:MAG: DUF4244 domain-containing protein [Acidimicrobiales bacterium]
MHAHRPALAVDPSVSADPKPALTAPDPSTRPRSADRSPEIGDAAPARRWREAGQATAEYALVLLGAAAIALLLAAWAAKSGAISKLFDAVVDELIAKVR